MCTCCKWVTGKPLWRSLDLPDIYWMIGSLQALHGLRIWTSCDGKQKPLVCVHVVSLNIAGWNRRSWVRYDPRQTVTVWHSRSGHNTATDAVVYRQAKQNTLKKKNQLPLWSQLATTGRDEVWHVRRSVSLIISGPPVGSCRSTSRSLTPSNYLKVR